MTLENEDQLISILIRYMPKVCLYLLIMLMGDTETTVHSFVSSRLDYCNSLYFGLPKKQIKRLQGMNDTAVCLVIVTGKYEHILPS